MSETMEEKKTQTEIDVLSIDIKLHRTIVKQFRKLIMLDVVSFTIFSAVLGFFAFESGFKIIPFIFFVLCMIGLLYNLISLLKIMMKKYQCCQVTVDKVWEEEGTYLCCITPDTYQGYKFTGELTIKNYTKDYKDVKVGDKVIVAAGKFSRYIYLFNYEGEIFVSERRTIAVKENPNYSDAKTLENTYGDIRELSIEGVGRVLFRRMETDEGVVYEHQEGLNESFFGPHCIIEVEECTIPEEQLDDAIAAIEATYRNSDIILDSFYDMVQRTISSAGAMPLETGEIDKPYLQEAFVIEEMKVRVFDMLLHGKDDIEVHFYGNIEDANGKWLLPGKAFLININCMSGEVNFELKDF